MVRVIVLPNGRQCRLSTYASAWRALIAADPRESIKGFDHFSSPAGYILARMRAALQDRINIRGCLVVRECSPSRVFKLRQRAHAQGRFTVRCRTCGGPVEPPVNFNSDMGRFCSDQCRRDWL